MSRLDRYQAAQLLVMEILQGNPARDEQMFMQAIDDIIDGVRAGRKNQAEFPKVVAEMEARGMFSVRVDDKPHLRLVTEEQFDDLVREGV
jgi:hypothetical protein